MLKDRRDNIISTRICIKKRDGADMDYKNGFKKVYVLFLLVVVLFSTAGCETSADIKAREQQARQDFIARACQSYQEGIAIFQEMDFSNPDKVKADEASSAFFAGTDKNMEFSDRRDCGTEINRSCPNAQELYYAAHCLEIIGEWGSIEKGLTIKDSMLRYYADLIPENYNGLFKEKVLPLRNQIIDIDENVVKPLKEAKKAWHRELQAEYNRAYSERVAKMKGDDPYYDEEYYAAGHYEEDYDDDGYRVDRRADRQQREMPSNSWRMRQRDR